MEAPDYAINTERLTPAEKDMGVRLLNVPYGRKEPVFCPYCHSERVKITGTHGGCRYYQCQICVLPGNRGRRTGQLTTFKVAIAQE